MDEVVELFAFGEVDCVVAAASCNAGVVRARQSRSTGKCTDGSTAGNSLE